jgi:hypothetical protein
VLAVGPLRPLVAACVAGLGLFAILPSCGGGESFTATRSITSTVTLAGESRLVVNLPLPVVLRGERREDVVVAADFTITASTSTPASNVADTIQILTERRDGDLFIGLGEPTTRGRFAAGGVVIRLPRDVDLDVTERGGTVEIEGIEGKIRVNSLGHVRVTGAEDDVFVAVQSGNALVDTDLRPGGSTTVQLVRGDIQLTTPAAVSADIEAVSESGLIVIAHPSLPRYPGGGLPYRANVGGGLNTVRLSTRSGVVVIGSR